MIRHEVKQGSLDWLILHCGIPTASEFDQLVTPKFEIRTGDMPKSYLAKKVAEAWQGGPLPGFGSWETDQGQLLESEAVPWYELEYNVGVDRVGFCTTDSKRIGCSPDGLLGEDSGIEIKCPNADTHVRYLLAGELPKDYAAQVYGCMYVTGRKTWRFLSYRRHFPPMVLAVNWDDALILKLEEALFLFLEKFDHAMAKMAEINGGPPPPRPEYRPESEPQIHGPLFERDPNDVMP